MKIDKRLLKFTQKQLGYSDEQMAVDIGEKPLVTVFACENSALEAASAAGSSSQRYDPKVRLIRVPCAGKVAPKQVLAALEAGAEKVMILGCHQENCHYLTGSTHAARRIEHLADTLEKVGVDRNRVGFGELASMEGMKFLSYVKES